MKKTKSLPIRAGVKAVEYHRNPTASEIKFGHGAIHYRTFPLSECTRKDGSLKDIFKAKDDGLYYSCR